METKKYGTIYRRLHKEIRNRCKQAVEEWLKGKCSEIEIITDKADMHKKN